MWNPAKSLTLSLVSTILVMSPALAQEAPPIPAISTPQTQQVQAPQVTTTQSAPKMDINTNIPSFSSLQQFGTISPLDFNKSTDQPHLSQPTGIGSALQSATQPSITNKNLMGSATDGKALADKIQPELNKIIEVYRAAQSPQERQKILSAFVEMYNYAVQAGAPELLNNKQFTGFLTSLSNVANTPNNPYLSGDQTAMVALLSQLQSVLFATARNEKTGLAGTQQDQAAQLAALSATAQNMQNQATASFISSAIQIAGTASAMQQAASTQSSISGGKPSTQSDKFQDASKLQDTSNSLSSLAQALQSAAGKKPEDTTGSPSPPTSNSSSTANSNAIARATDQMQASIGAMMNLISLNQATANKVTQAAGVAGNSSAKPTTTTDTSSGSSNTGIMGKPQGGTTSTSPATPSAEALATFKNATEKLGATNTGLNTLQTQYQNITNQINKINKTTPGGIIQMTVLNAQQATISTQIAALKSVQAADQNSFVAAFSKVAGAPAASQLSQLIAGKTLTTEQLVAAAASIKH